MIISLRVMASLRHSSYVYYTRYFKSGNPGRIHFFFKSYLPACASSAFHNYHSKHCYHDYRVLTNHCKFNGLLGTLGMAEHHSFHMKSVPGHTKSQKFNIQYQQSSHLSSSAKVQVTRDTIFSGSNKQRLQDHLLNTGKPSTSEQKKDTSSSNKSSHAAVLVPLCTVDGEPSILFTLRSTSLRKHRGQVSFPGGMMDEMDRDVIHTALRETQEELGIAMETVDVWGTMMDLPTRDKHFVTPVVGHCGEIDINKLTLSEDEVELVFPRTIKSLCDLRYVRHTQFRSGYTMPVYLGSEHRIWGLTSIILHQVLTMLAPGLYQYKLRHRS